MVQLGQQIQQHAEQIGQLTQQSEGVAQQLIQAGLGVAQIAQQQALTSQQQVQANQRIGALEACLEQDVVAPHHAASERRWRAAIIFFRRLRGEAHSYV